MKLNEMNQSKKTTAKRALKEHFEVNVNFDRLGLGDTKNMLKRVRGLLSESRTGKESHTRHQNPAYMKLVMMEQALTSHYGDLRVQQQIMLENEEVQKSQVILSAQDMIDTIQKMVEQISKMKVEELPAVVTGVNNEIGTEEGTQFDQSVGQALGTLEQALGAAKGSLQTALGTITGQGGAPAGEEFGGADDMGGDDLDGDMGDMGADDMGDMGADDMGGELPEPEDEPEEPLGGAGRERR